ncbi:hypothetical protein GCM10009775_31910 [Microbacterium aoyamense]|uniref:Uncharacterized protein n=1 Tax=Microbacterium aoyamense TaxID=344166 RepID=A0ABN2PYB9_9MICO|nr:hypothetical protein [Microbacterium aoyamense]
MEFAERQRINGAIEAVRVRLDEFLWADGAADRPDWERFEHPVIVRGTHAIIPLLVATDPTSDEDFSEIMRLLTPDWLYFYGGHDYRVGRFGEDDEWGRRVLSRALEAQGLDVTFWWEMNTHGVILASTVNPTDGSRALAVHVVPRAWIFAGNRTVPHTARDFADARRAERRAAAADLHWTPEDIGATPAGLWVTHSVG